MQSGGVCVCVVSDIRLIIQQTRFLESQVNHAEWGGGGGGGGQGRV